MNGESQSLSLGEAAGHFLVSLSSEAREMSQQEVYRFARWYGWERPFAGLAAPDVANYAERLSLSDTDYTRKLELIRAFLVYAKKQGWSKSKLAVHLKTKKGKASPRLAHRRGAPEAVRLTRQGYAELEAELAALKGKRPQIIEEISRAAADKDFSENAPLDAAKEQYGQLEGRIRELEEALKLATIIDEKQSVTSKVGVGDSVILRDLATNEELRYMLVGPREVDPTKGKISNASPIGKAIVGRGEGEVVEVAAPAGKLRYEIKQIEH
ncbi:Transcription elongation factor GreA [subsurface metagenome]